MLSPSDLRGYLVSIPIPWDDNGDLLTDLFRGAIHKFLTEGCDGLYLFGTSGEGYAVTEEEFSQIVGVFADETSDAGVFRQVGCFGLSSDQVKDRCAIVVERGIEGVQFTLPFWKEVSDPELILYFEDVCGHFPGLSFMLYNTPRNRRKLSGKELAGIQEQVPNLHGAKTGGGDWFGFFELLTEAPAIRHFVTEPAFLFCRTLGAAGVIPSSNYCRPRACRQYYDAVVNGRLDEAWALHRDIIRFFHTTAVPLVSKGYIDGAIDKAYAKIGGTEIPLTMKSPYVALTAEDYAWLERTILSEFPDIPAG